MELLHISNGKLHAKVNASNMQLVSLRYNVVELLHGGGLPNELQTASDCLGWPNTEIIMFPVVGPVKENSISVATSQVPMTQHGIARHLPWYITQHTDSEISMEQRYIANTPVPNNKIATPLLWPFSYKIVKKISITPQALVCSITLTNNSEKEMPFSLGWHPAFFTGDLENTTQISVNDKVYSLEEIRAAGNDAVIVKTNRVTLLRKEITIVIAAEWSYFILWSPNNAKLVCIEPITTVPTPSGMSNFSAQHFLLAPKQDRIFTANICIMDEKTK